MSKGLTYARFFPSNWRSGTVSTLNLEEEGLYIRCCAFMWDTGQPIPGNESVAARLLNVQVQKYQKVMASLIDKGKMVRAQGVLINERVVEDLEDFKMERMARSDRAKTGHETRKSSSDKLAGLETEIARLKAALNEQASATPPHQPPHQPPHLPGGGSLGGTPPPPPIGDAKKDNKNNGRIEQAESTCSAILESRRQKIEEVPPLAPPRGGEAPKAGSARTGRTARGERLPDDWVLPKSWGEWALDHFEATSDEIRAEAATFRDFWVSKPGSAGCKLDWLATWRNWVRSSAGRKRWPIRKPESSIAPGLVSQGGVAGKAAELAGLDDAHQRDLVARHANGIWPMEKLLHPPGHPRCVIRPANYRAVGIDEDTYDQNGIRRDGRH